MSYIGNSLAQGLVSGANIQDGTVDTPDLKDSSVTTAKIADGSITTAKIANDAVVTADIANDAVTTAKIAANAVSPAKMDFSAGSANALVYLNGSKVPTTSNVLTFDGSRLFLGTNAVTTSSSQSGEIYSGGAVGFLFTNSTAANYALSVKNEGTSGTRALVNFYEGAGGGTSRANIAFDGSNNLLLTAANSFVANVSQFGVGATPTAKFSVSIGAGNSGTVARFSAPSYDDVYVSAGASAQSCGIGTVSSSQFNIFVNGSSRVRVLNSGFMGVGVDPTCSLDASGVIRSREGAFVLNNGATQHGGLFTYNRIFGSGTDYSATIFAETGLGINFCVNGSATKQSVLTSGGNWGLGLSTAYSAATVTANSASNVVSYRVMDQNNDGSSGTARYTALAYYARRDNNIRSSPPLQDGGATAAIVFTDRPGTSGYPTAVRTSDIEFWTATSTGGTGLDARPNKVASVTAEGVLNLFYGKVQFPSAQSASSDPNTLDDYEEGTWTPRLGGSSGGDYTPGGTNEGRYIKIGKMVYATCTLHWTAQVTAYSGNLWVSGLPFTNNGIRSVGSMGAIDGGLTFTAGYGEWNYLLDPGFTAVYIIQNSTTGAGYSHTPTVATSGRVYAMTLVYEA